MHIASPFHIAIILSAGLAIHAQAQERRILESVLPDARTHGATWRYTTEAPSLDWAATGFDDQAWLTGQGGFGSGDEGGGAFNTAWTSLEIWMRTTFSLDKSRFEEILLSLRHDDDADVYVNGIQVLAEPGFTTAYGEFFLPTDAVAALKPEGNVLAVHCSNAGGGLQYVDAGLFGSRTVTVAALVPDARIQAQAWKYVVSDPGLGWQAAGIAEDDWGQGTGGFGSMDIYADKVGSEWTGPDIWLRKTFTVDREYPEYQLTFQHDDAVEIYINGKPVMQAGGWSADYKEVLLSAADAGVKAGENVIAVHCSNSGTGPQFVDVGLLGLQGPGVTRLRPKGKAVPGMAGAAKGIRGSFTADGRRAAGRHAEGGFFRLP